VEQLPAAVKGTERGPERLHLEESQFHEDARGGVVGIGCSNGQWAPVEPCPKTEGINCRFSNPRSAGRPSFNCHRGPGAEKTGVDARARRR